MTPDDSEAFRQLMGTLYVTVEKDFDEAQVRFYWDALKDLPLGELQQAAVVVMQGHKWRSVPLPADFRLVVQRERFEARRRLCEGLAAQPLTAVIACADCSDTGWRGNPESGVSPCPCRSGNPNYRRSRAQELLAGEANQAGAVTAAEATNAIGAVRDFKRIGSGE